MTSLPEDDHECRWRREAVEAIAKIDRLEAEMEALRHQLKGHKSEKMPPLEREVHARTDKEDRRAEELRKRKERAVEKTALVTVAAHTG